MYGVTTVLGVLENIAIPLDKKLNVTNAELNW